MDFIHAVGAGIGAVIAGVVGIGFLAFYSVTCVPYNIVATPIHNWEINKSNEATSKFFEEADTNHDGILSKEELKAILYQSFVKLDTNGDGRLSAQEIDAAGYSGYLKTWITHIDTNHDGFISFDEAWADAEKRFDARDRTGQGLTLKQLILKPYNVSCFQFAP